MTPASPQVAFLRLHIPNWAGRLRIAHLSGLYAGAATPIDLQVAAVQRINDAAPDLTVLTGDFVTRGRRALDQLTGVLLGLESPALAVLGERDRLVGAAAVSEALARGGVRVLGDTCDAFGESAETVAVEGAHSGEALLLGVASSPHSAPLLWALGAPLVLAGSSRPHAKERAFPDGWSGTDAGQVYAHPGLGTPGIHKPARRHVAILDLVGAPAAACDEPIVRPWDFAAA